MSTDHHDQPAPEAGRVAEVLAQLRAGVRQRQALLATVPEETLQLPASLAQVQATQYLERPVPHSHRRWLGPPIVFAKKVVYHLFMKWYLSSLLQQQTDFNRAVAVALQDLFERQRALARAIAESRGASSAEGGAIADRGSRIADSGS